MCASSLSLSHTISLTIVFDNFELKSDSKLSSVHDVYVHGECSITWVMYWINIPFHISLCHLRFFRFHSKAKKYFIFFISYFVLFCFLCVSPFGRCFCVTSFILDFSSPQLIAACHYCKYYFVFPFRHRSVLLVLIVCSKSRLYVVRRHTQWENNGNVEAMAWLLMSMTLNIHAHMKKHCHCNANYSYIPFPALFPSLALALSHFLNLAFFPTFHHVRHVASRASF